MISRSQQSTPELDFLLRDTGQSTGAAIPPGCYAAVICGVSHGNGSTVQGSQSAWDGADGAGSLRCRLGWYIPGLRDLAATTS